MKLTVLGSGTALSDANRAASGFVLELAGKKILIDFGFGCFKNLQKAGFDYTKLNNFFFTHFEHPDHVNDLSAFLFARKISVLLKYSESTQINLFGGPDFSSFFQNLTTTYPVLQNTLVKTVASELGKFEKKKFGGFALTTKPMDHAPSSLGLRFEANNKTVVFSGDTAYNENLVELAKDADLLILECSFAGKGRSDHLNIDTIAKTAFKANAKALLLTHFYPDAEKADLKSYLSKKFVGKIYLAKDLMQVDV